MSLNDEKNSYLRAIPSVESLLGHDLIKSRCGLYSRKNLLQGIRKVLEQKRAFLLAQDNLEEISKTSLSIDSLVSEIEECLYRMSFSSMERVINGTGIILHTNLGRAVMAKEVIEKLSLLAGTYCNLEFDLLSGKRGKRGDSVVELLSQLTGAEDALVVNNNAAAVLLVLHTLTRGKEVIVSRGELVEIGGSFRIPEILKEGGARLVEVGTTNKTRLKDYQRAITLETAAILKVHPSNYRIIGFTEEVPLSELIQLGQERQLPVIYDLGSGLLVDLGPYGLEEPVVARLIQEGPDVVTFSGDKLLGGPQAGIILCKKKYGQALRENPLLRALRPDKMTLSSLETTLKLYQEPEVLEKIPVLRMITVPLEAIAEKGRKILQGFQELVPRSFSFQLALVDDPAKVGGGSFSIQTISSLAVAISLEEGNLDHLAEELRQRHPPILGHIHQQQFRLNLRTVLEEDIPELIQGIHEVISKWGVSGSE